jgi:hypothetical protein
MRRKVSKASALIGIVTLAACCALQAQTTRNPVLEYCSGTWCGWCPCGHAIIDGTIRTNIPNAIIIGYHGPAGSDPYAAFPGNGILSTLGYISYPTGVIDRTNPFPISRDDWSAAMNSRIAVNATVRLAIGKTYTSSTRTLNATVYVEPLTTLTGQYKLTFMLLENNLIYAQVGFTGNGCIGGNHYVHHDVVRAMINGEQGDALNNPSPWIPGQEISRTFSYTVDAAFVEANCTLVAFVYRVESSLSMSEIQQAQKWNLVGTIIVPVQLSSFTARVLNANTVLLEWRTISEVNNYGFFVQRARSAAGPWTELPSSFVAGHGTTNEPHEYSFADRTVTSGTWFYRLRQVDLDGTVQLTEPVRADVPTEVRADAPRQFRLRQNYPNPFNPATTFGFQIGGERDVPARLTVLDLLGREIGVIVNEVMAPGEYEIQWDASHLSSGAYFYKLAAGSFSEMRKLILAK